MGLGNENTIDPEIRKQNRSIPNSEEIEIRMGGMEDNKQMVLGNIRTGNVIELWWFHGGILSKPGMGSLGACPYLGSPWESLANP